MVGLGDLPGGFVRSSAQAVTPDGSVIAGTGYSASGYEAFRWTSGGGMVGLGELPGGSFESAAWGLSADGLLLVGVSESGSGREAFSWTSGGGMVGLGDFPGGTFWSEARDASADGSVIVGYGNTASGQEAFIWDSANGMREVDQVLIALGLDLTGWTLTQVSAISDDGLIIAGYGTNPSSQPEAWLARVPEPSTTLLLGVGLAGLAFLKRMTGEDLTR
jgi:probable HAF family extracellular repeat protein